jgi:hypothetical protein
MSSDNDAILKAIWIAMSRLAIPPRKLVDIIAPKGKADKQVKAYNLCDGDKTQGDIAKSLKLDSGNFSRTVARWVDEGVVIRLGIGREARLLHAYPITSDMLKGGREL